MYENGIAPTWPINEKTLVFDTETNRQVVFLDGRLVLPVGSTIELYDESTHKHGTATVTGIRLLNGIKTEPNQVCLDVTVEARWWDAHPYTD